MKSALSFVVLFAALGVAMNVSTAEAAKGGKKEAPKAMKAPEHHQHMAGAEHHRNMTPHHAFMGNMANNTQVIQQLESARATLNKADHDYSGHRAAAVNQLSNTIHHLQHGKAHPSPGQHFVAGKNKEPQAESDAKLQQALATLQGVSAPAGPQAAIVKTGVSKAIADIQKALKVD